MPIQTAIDSISNNQGSPFGFKNRIINGGMVIDQRSAGASTTVTSNGYYSCDRWTTYASQSSKYSIQQNAGSVTPPAGFSNYIGVTSLSAYSITSTDYFSLLQQIEGYNIADFAWGTVNAVTVTLSFWVRSSLTGTFGGALRGGSGANRSYPFTYTISSANTWEQKTITIAGDTTSAWTTNNGSGLIVYFGLGVGSTYSGTAGSWQASGLNSATGATSVVGTNGATFYITGVQLEKGTQATSFDYRPFGTELQLCQRYFQKSYDILTDKLGTVTTTGEVRWVAATVAGESAPTVMLPVVMRTTPTIIFYNTQTGASGSVYNYSASTSTAMTGTNVSGSRGWSGGNSSFTAGHIIGYHYGATAEL